MSGHAAAEAWSPLPSHAPGEAGGLVPDTVKGVPFTPVQTSNPEASSLAMMGVVVTAAAAVGLLRRARKPVA